MSCRAATMKWRLLCALGSKHRLIGIVRLMPPGHVPLVGKGAAIGFLIGLHHSLSLTHPPDWARGRSVNQPIGIWHGLWQWLPEAGSGMAAVCWFAASVSGSAIGYCLAFSPEQTFDCSYDHLRGPGHYNDPLRAPVQQFPFPCAAGKYGLV